MASLLERKLIVVTGKGGAGKSTIAGALGLLGAQRGLRTIVVEVGARNHLAALYGKGTNVRGHDHARPDSTDGPGTAIELERCLWTLALDPDAALIEWVRRLGGRLSARVLASSSSFQYFAAAAPGAEELVSLVELHDLSAGGDGPYDLAVLDAPATGHALAMLASPGTFTAIVRNGPLARRASAVREMLSDPLTSGYVAVTRATEMAVTETLDLQHGLHEQLDRGLDAVIVNGTIARRFSAEELIGLSAAASGDASQGNSPLAAVARAALTASERTRAQRRQIARLRRLRSAHGSAPSIATVPFAFVQQIDRRALAEIAARLARSLRLERQLS